MSTMLSVENISKFYRLGTIGGGTLRGDLERWWAHVRRQEDPLLKIDETNHQNREGEYIWALRDVSFEAHDGEVVGIIGRNGAGKSTLLKILSRVTAPTSGEIKVDGRIASLLEIGTGFHPELTGRENIYLNGAILGMKRAEVSRKFDEIVAFSEVNQFIDTPVKRYSSGMYVRLAFAVAAHLDPEILIVDEVLAVGDAAFQKKSLGKMGDVARAGRTVLFVSHNMSSISALCTRVIYIKNGAIHFDGDVRTGIGEYHDDVNRKQDVIVSFPKDEHNPRLVKACFLNSNLQPSNHEIMGCSFGIQAEFQSPYPIIDPMLGIRINTPMGVTVFGVNNLMQSKIDLCEESKHGTFRVIFPMPCLNQGTYYITLVLSDRAKEFHRASDVLLFTIDPADIYDTGKIPSPSQSLTTMDGNWSFFDQEGINVW